MENKTASLKKVKPKPVAPSKAVLVKTKIRKLAPSKEYDDETRSWLAKWVLIGIAPFVLLMLGIIIIYAPDHAARLDALKYMFPSVVSLLTLVLGYYFGQQQKR